MKWENAKEQKARKQAKRITDGRAKWVTNKWIRDKQRTDMLQMQLRVTRRTKSVQQSPTELRTHKQASRLEKTGHWFKPSVSQMRAVTSTRKLASLLYRKMPNEEESNEWMRDSNNKSTGCRLSLTIENCLRQEMANFQMPWAKETSFERSRFFSYTRAQLEHQDCSNTWGKSRAQTKSNKPQQNSRIRMIAEEGMFLTRAEQVNTRRSKAGCQEWPRAGWQSEQIPSIRESIVWSPAKFLCKTGKSVQKPIENRGNWTIHVRSF